MGFNYTDFGIFFFAEYCSNYDKSIPLNNDVLDRMMKKVIEEDNRLKLPLKLNFTELNTGLIKCVELEEMIQAAYDSEIIRYNEDYTKCVSSISKTCAEAIIKNNHIPKEVRQFSSKVFKKLSNQ